MKDTKLSLVSVIIPAYNAAVVLERCVRSVMKQTYPVLEVILVNDGSKDGTGKIADALAVEDNRIHVIHKANGGVSAARNDALKHVRGEWITFVDADDYLEPDFLQSLLEGEKADLIVSGYHTVGANEITSASYPSVTARNREEIKTVLEGRITDMTFLCPWGKLFRTSLIQSQNQTFPIDMRVGEDVMFVWSYLAHCSLIALKPGQGYNYFTEENADFKYALDGITSLRTIERIWEPLNRLNRIFGMDTEHASCHILNYYIWLFKLNVKRNFSLEDLGLLKAFFYNPLVFNYYKRYKKASKDKFLVYMLLKLRMPFVLYLLIKIYY